MERARDACRHAARGDRPSQSGSRAHPLAAEVQQRLRGVEIKTSDPQTVARMIREDTIRWTKVIREFDVKPEN